jgi:hypothetical protein
MPQKDSLRIIQEKRVIHDAGKEFDAGCRVRRYDRIARFRRLRRDRCRGVEMSPVWKSYRRRLRRASPDAGRINDVDILVRFGIPRARDHPAITEVGIENRHSEMLTGNDEALSAHDEHELRVVRRIEKGPMIGDIGATLLGRDRRIDVIRCDARGWW